MTSFTMPPIAHAFSAMHHLQALEDWHRQHPNGEGQDLPDLAGALATVRRYVQAHQELEQQQCRSWSYR